MKGPTMTNTNSTQTIHCQNCQARIPAGLLCLTDVDTMRSIYAELDDWSRELACAASGLRGIDYSAVRIRTAPGSREPVDLATLGLARMLDDAAAAWARELDLLATADRRVVAVWELGPECLSAMIRAESAALGRLDPTELVKRREARHRARAARQGRPGARPPWQRLADALAPVVARPGD